MRCLTKFLAAVLAQSDNDRRGSAPLRGSRRGLQSEQTFLYRILWRRQINQILGPAESTSARQEHCWARPLVRILPSLFYLSRACCLWRYGCFVTFSIYTHPLFRFLRSAQQRCIYTMKQPSHSQFCNINLGQGLHRPQ